MDSDSYSNRIKTISGTVRPDSHWGWLVAFGNMIQMMFTEGLMRCFTVFYRPIMYEFDVKYGKVSFLSGLFIGSFAFGALSFSVLKRLGCRRVGLISITANCFSLSLASQCTSLMQLYLAFGISSGFFAGLSINNMFFSCSVYFIKHRAKALSTMMAGVSLTQLMFSPIIDRLIATYQWRGALLIMSGLAMHGIAAVMLYRPVTSTTRKLCDSNSQEDRSENYGKDTQTHRRCSALSTGFSVCCYPKFLLMLVASVSFWVAAFGAEFLLVPFGLETVGLTSLQASLLLSAQSVGDIIGKLCAGPICDLKRVDRFFFLTIANIFSALVIFLFTLSKSYVPAMAMSFLQGITRAPFSGIYIMLYYELVKKSQIPSAIAFDGFCLSIFSLPMYTVLGSVIDATDGDVRIPNYACAIALLLSSACLFLIYTLKRKDRRNENKKGNEVS